MQISPEAVLGRYWEPRTYYSSTSRFTWSFFFSSENPQKLHSPRYHHMARSRTFIRPNTPLVPGPVKLSPLDQFTNRVYTPLLLLFKIDASVQRDIICSDLQIGLSSLINDVPFIAGNVVLEDEETGNLQIDIPDDAGVMFSVREMSDPTKRPVLDFEELKKAAFSSSLLDPSELSPLHFAPEPVAPVLAVQANFIRGGLILAVFIHHSAADAIGLLTLSKRWSRLVSAEVASCAIHGSESFPNEALDRSVLVPDTGTWRRLYDFPGFVKARKEIQDIEHKEKNNEFVEQPAALTIAYWYVSPSGLQALEEIAKPTDKTGRSFTQSSVLTALIWQHCTRAQRLDKHGVETVSIWVRCDIRGRLDPPLHPQFIGNAVIHCRAETSLADFDSAKPDALYRIAAKINDSIEWYSSDNIWDLLAAMSACPRFGEAEPTVDEFSESNFKITNMSVASLNDSQWGSRMGTPCAIRFPGIFVLDGQSVVFPRLPDGGIEFSTHLTVEVLQRLKADPVFTKHVQFRCS